MLPTVPDLLKRAADLWWESDTTLPPLGRAFTSREQALREGHMDRFLDALSAEMKRQPRTKAERQAARERLLARAVDLGKSAFDLQDRHVEAMRSYGFIEVATEFAQRARRFDATISNEDIFQAGRNALVMNALQALLGQPMAITPAVFGYSMLYPYTDNYMDDPAIPEVARLDLSGRFAKRLMGESVPPANEREGRIWDMVGAIESQWPRSSHPGVYESLLAIHRAQHRSLNLLRGGASPYEVDVLGISIEKGGSSVLADGYLVAGSLTEAQAEFIFGWGAFMQLIDDLQDVHADARDGRLTIFSQTARAWPLDALTNRTLQFGQQALKGLSSFDSPRIEPLKELIELSHALMLLVSAALAERMYTKPYLRSLEAHSPFRFDYIRKRRQKLGRQRPLMARLIEAFATVDD